MDLLQMNRPKAQKVICPKCRGRGSWDEMGSEVCYSCVGTGRDVNSDLMAFPCNRCGGKGKRLYCRTVTCGHCHGSGYMNCW